MDCPACANPLHQVRIEDAHYHCCRTCHGIWTDAGLLPAIIRHAAPSNALRKRAQSPTRTRRCPACHGKMEQSIYSFDSGIVIDACPRCNGIWLDAHEAEQIAAYLGADDPREPAAQALCQEVRQTHALHAGLDVDTAWPSFMVSQLPLPDADALAQRPWVLFALVLANLAVMAAFTYSGPDPAPFFKAFGADGIGIITGRRFFTLGTYLFVHANALHLIGNMLFLLACGPAVENEIGHARFAGLFFLLGALSLVPELGRNVLAIGASGAISGLMGFCFTALPLRRIWVATWRGPLELPMLYVFGSWLVVQVFYAHFLSLAGTATNIGFSAHLAGFAAGLLLGLVHRRNRRAEPSLPAAD